MPYYNDLIKRFAEFIELDDLDDFDMDKIGEGLSLELGETVVQFEILDGQLLAFILLDALPEDRAVALRSQFLSDNRYFRDTGGASIGVSSKGVVTVQRLIGNPNLDAETFGGMLTRLIETAGRLRELLANEEPEAPSSDEKYETPHTTVIRG